MESSGRGPPELAAPRPTAHIRALRAAASSVGALSKQARPKYGPCARPLPQPQNSYIIRLSRIKAEYTMAEHAIRRAALASAADLPLVRH
jgi:hypothetical protein